MEEEVPNRLKGEDEYLMPKKTLSQKEINDIIGLKSGLKSSTLRKVWSNVILLILSELQNYGSIKFQDLGEFKVVHEGGKDEIFINTFGIPEKRYVQPKDFVEFTPTKQFITLLNGDRLAHITYEELLKKKEKQQQDKNKKYTYEDFVNETEENPLNTTIQKFANKRQKINNKQAQIRNGTYTYSTRRYSKQKIESEGITYDSIKEFADFLSVKYFNLWKQIKSKGDVGTVYGHEYKLIKE